MKLNNIMETLERIAPLHLAQEWDNVGLLAGDPNQSITKILLTIDLTPQVMAEAARSAVNLIVAYHPPIWQPLKKIVAGQAACPSLHGCIRKNIAIYSLHTALDCAQGGVNDVLADIIGIENPAPLQQLNPQTSTICKLVVFVPESDLENVSQAIFSAGAGNVGQPEKYSKCSFRARGTGTFQCGPGSNPTIGKRGRFETVDEFRLESIIPVDKLAAAVKAMRSAHSYEEVAYDVIPLLDSPADLGLGRFGKLKNPTTVAELLRKIKKQLKTKTLGLIGGSQHRIIKTAAVCAGSCGSTLRSVISRNCDFYLTGELKHHHALEMQNAGIITVCAGHSVSERIILPKLARKLRAAGRDKLQVIISRQDRNPFNWC
jgi:dinuclear metal center YbgI/SA1388 family protein